MSGIPIALTEILRRYAFSYTQLRGRVVPHEVHGALRAPPNEADLGPARLRAGVHRRERCGPEIDCTCLARRLVQGAPGGQPAPARCFLARARGGSRLGLQGQLSRPVPTKAAPLPPRPGDREPAKPTKKHCNGFMRHGRRFAVPFLCVHVCVLPPEASGVARTRPGPVFWDVSAAAAPSLGEGGDGRGGGLSGPREGPRTARGGDTLLLHAKQNYSRRRRFEPSATS